MSDLTDFRVAVIATDGFEEAELMEPAQVLRDAGAEVLIVGRGVAKSKDLTTITRAKPSKSTSFSRIAVPTISTRSYCRAGL